MLIRCGTDNACLNEQRDALSDYLESDPQQNFSISGNVEDEVGNPLSGATITLSGSQSAAGLTDALGNFRITNLPTTGHYTITVSKRHYMFTNASHTVVRPSRDVTGVDFSATLNRHTIFGRLTKPNGAGIPGVPVHLVQLSISTVTTDKDGNYSFTNLPAGQNYTIAPVAHGFLVVAPVNQVVNDLAEDVRINFTGRLRPEIVTVQNTDVALVVDSVSFVGQPFSIFHPIEFAGDGMARVVIFAKNLEDVKDPSQTILTAEDPNHLVYPLPVEFVGDIPGQIWLKQLNIRLLPSIGHKCFKLRLYVDNLQSDPARVCFAPASSGS